MMPDDLVSRMLRAEVAACNCDTKASEPGVHDDVCRYRALADGVAEIEKLRADGERVARVVEEICWAAEKEPQGSGWEEQLYDWARQLEETSAKESIPSTGGKDAGS